MSPFPPLLSPQLSFSFALFLVLFLYLSVWLFIFAELLSLLFFLSIFILFCFSIRIDCFFESVAFSSLLLILSWIFAPTWRRGRLGSRAFYGRRRRYRRRLRYRRRRCRQRERSSRNSHFFRTIPQWLGIKSGKLFVISLLRSPYGPSRFCFTLVI